MPDQEQIDESKANLDAAKENASEVVADSDSPGAPKGQTLHKGSNVSGPIVNDYVTGMSIKPDGHHNPEPVVTPVEPVKGPAYTDSEYIINDYGQTIPGKTVAVSDKPLSPANEPATGAIVLPPAVPSRPGKK
jgi:hypothetical protein